MQLGDFAGGAFVHRDLVFLGLRFVVGQKQVAIYVFGKVGQLVLEWRCMRRQVVEVQVFKVADQAVVGQLGFGQAGQVFGGLGEGFFQVFATRFHFDQQLAGVKTVDAPAFAAQLFHTLLKADHALVRKAKHLAQTPDEVLCLAHFVMCAGKLAHKAVGALQYLVFVERDRHRCCIPVDER